MKLKLNKIILIAVLLLVPVFALKAATTDNNSSIFVASDETISGNLLAFADTVIVDGIISGDLIVTANYITVTGRVEGDIIALGQDINIEGEVGGNVRVIGNTITINGVISRNLNAFGPKVLIGENAKVGWDVIVGSIDATIRGTIAGSLDSYVQNIFIAGKIGKGVNLRVYKAGNNSVILDKGATINGDLNYSADKKFNITNVAGISGEISYNELGANSKSPTSSWLWGRLFSLLSLLFIGLIFVFIIPRYTNNFILEAKQKIGTSFIWGSAAFLIIPPLALLVALTIIGLPLTLILISIWLASFFIGKTVAAVIIGDVIIKKLFKKEYNNLFWPLLMGAIILALLFSIPWFGYLVSIIAIWLGWGTILSYVANKPKNI